MRAVALSDLRQLTQANPRGVSVGDLVQLGNQVAMVERLDPAGRRVLVEPLDISVSELDKAEKDYRHFHGKAPSHLTVHQALQLSGPAWELGKLRAVLYEADTEQGSRLYWHPFKKSARPTLAAMRRNGRNLVTLGGAFQVTTRGIVDD